LRDTRHRNTCSAFATVHSRRKREKRAGKKQEEQTARTRAKEGDELWPLKAHFTSEGSRFHICKLVFVHINTLIFGISLLFGLTLLIQHFVYMSISS